MAVDRLGRPLRDDPYRGNVRVYAASNITLSGLQTIDGVTLESGDRVLCNGQTTTSQNGIYVASNGVWSRSRDLSTSDDFTGPIIVTVEEGDTYRNTFWHMLPSTTITVGTDAISFTTGYPAAQFGNGDALSVFGRASNSSGVRADIAAGTDHHVLRRSGTSLGFGLIANANVDASAAIEATKIANTPAGNIAATTVQAAINELDTEKVAKSGDTMTGDLAMSGANITLTDTTAEPPQFGSENGSVGSGPIYVLYKRTGGFGAYGNVLVNATVTAATTTNFLDSGLTSWQSHQDLTGGQVFGGWIGANTPSDSEGDTYSSGAAIGAEINAGNRWADFGRQTDVGGTRYTVGVQIVPDVLPEQGRAYDLTTYPGSFGTVVGPSVHGHRWWTGYLQRTDTLVATGYAFHLKGGSDAPNAPNALQKVEGHWVDLFDTSSATLSGAIIKPATTGQDIGTTTARVRAIYTQGLLVVNAADSSSQTNDSTFKVANTSGAAFRIGLSGTAVNYISGSDLYFRNQGESQDLMRLQASTGNLTPEFAAGTRSLGTASKPWGPLYADSAVLGAPLPVASGGTGQTTAAEAIGGMTQALTTITAPSLTADLLPIYEASSDTGKNISILSILDTARTLRVLWTLTADMNTTADQAFTKIGSFTNWSIMILSARNPSSGITTAVGGIYPTTGKGGTPILAAATAWSSLSATNKSQVFGINQRDTDIAVPYLSLTTPEGSAKTLIIELIGLANP